MSQVITGEAVAIDLRVARVGSRMVGASLDAVVQIILLGVLVALSARAASDEAIGAALFLVSYVLAAVGYPLVLETLWNGKTLGKAAMGLRAVRDDGAPMRFRQALVRALMRAIVEGPFPLFGVPAIICSMISDRGKRIGDLMAGTVVLQERIPTSGTDVPYMPPPLAAWAGTLDLSRFDDAMALSARQFLGRAADLSDAARESLGARLVSAVQQVVTPPPPMGTPGWAYLSAVLAERRRRDEQRHGGWGLAPGGAFGAPGSTPQYGYGTSPYGQPSYGQPSYGQPQYGQPSYGQPQYGQPSYGQPQYPNPQYGQPQPQYQQTQQQQTQQQQTQQQQTQYQQTQYAPAHNGHAHPPQAQPSSPGAAPPPSFAKPQAAQPDQEPPNAPQDNPFTLPG